MRGKNVLNCRRCHSDRLLELARLDAEDHWVYRCRNCGFLFSPPEGHVTGENVIPAPTPDGPEEARRRLAELAAVRPGTERGPVAGRAR